jgi:tetratricopeptide (TPR) repeat protein
MKYLISLVSLVTALLLPALSLGGPLEDELLALQEDWARVQYQMPDKQKADAFEQLHLRATGMAEKYPERAEPLVWDGIILSTWAGAKGGLGALSLVKQAKSALERSLEIDDQALDGSAYTSLGSLYYQVPGWPIAFGDDDKAESLLQKALAINPDGIDSNFFYADFLKEQGRDDEARIYFQRAASAKQRPQRPLADQGRQEDISKKLRELNS